MASQHCYKPAEQIYAQGSVVQQGYGYSTETKSYSYTDQGLAKTETYYKETEAQYPTNQLTHTHSHGGGTHQHSGHGCTTSQGTRRTHRKSRNLLQRIKDGITGDSSSSSSDSESDDEHCRKRNLN